MRHFLSSFGVFVLFLLPTVAVHAQSDDVPKSVLTTFNNKYPNAEEVDWYTDEDDYTVSFVEDSYNVEATFKANGEWRQTVTNIDEMDLPKAAGSYIAGQFGKPDYFINITRMQTPGQLQYFVSFETATKTVSLIFNEDGSLAERNEEDIDQDK